MNKIKSEEFRTLSDKFPEDEIICKEILKILKNEEVKIKIDKESNSCLYSIYNNTITIGKFKENYIKIQTIAHECIHSVQSKIFLWFNFILSNIYNIYFLILIVLALFNKIQRTDIFAYILIIFAYLHYAVRGYLENDAMLKAKSLAKNYLDNTDCISKEESERLLNQYKKINRIGIPFYNFYLFFTNCLRIVIYCIIVNI